MLGPGLHVLVMFVCDGWRVHALLAVSDMRCGLGGVSLGNWLAYSLQWLQPFSN